MLPTPRKFTLVAGASEGDTKLTAFDKALLASGIGNLNLLKASSIVPPGAEYVEKLDIAPGSFTPTAYAMITSDVKGELISAAIGAGFSEQAFGIIMEFSGKCSKEEAKGKIKEMIIEAFQARGMETKRLLVKAVEHRVEKVGCAFAGAALWY